MFRKIGRRSGSDREIPVIPDMIQRMVMPWLATATVFPSFSCAILRSSARALRRTSPKVSAPSSLQCSASSRNARASSGWACRMFPKKHFSHGPTSSSRSAVLVWIGSCPRRAAASAVSTARRRSLEYTASTGIFENRSASASICRLPSAVIAPSQDPCIMR